MRQQNIGNNIVMEKSASNNILQKTQLDALKNAILSAANKTEKGGESKVQNASKDVVVVCFGTPMIAGDAFGPLVADELRQNLNVPVFVYGTTEHSVNGKNMDAWLDFIRVVHKGATIVAIDASLGDRVGSVVVRKDGVCPAAVKGRKRRFGDVGVLGIVAKNEGDSLAQLLTAEYSMVASLAEETARLVKESI